MGETARRKRKRTQLLMMLETTWKKSSPLNVRLDDLKYNIQYLYYTYRHLLFFKLIHYFCIIIVYQIFLWFHKCTNKVREIQTPGCHIWASEDIFGCQESLTKTLSAGFWSAHRCEGDPAFVRVWTPLLYWDEVLSWMVKLPISDCYPREGLRLVLLSDSDHDRRDLEGVVL